MTLKISNRQARYLLIDAHGLATPPIGPLDLPGLIHKMGYVQLDTIRNVTRAHHHILWSRNQNYRELMLWKALETRELFEHFTHDTSLLPMEFYGVWQRQFERMKERFATSTRWAGYSDLHEEVLARIAADGPLSTHAFDTKIEGKKEMWSRPPHKRALDYLWYTGELATCHREKFVKFYDLAERVIPSEYNHHSKPDAEQLDWLCTAAINRLGIATKAQLQDFWGAASAAEITVWLKNAAVIPIDIQANDGSWVSAFAAPDIENRLKTLRPPTSRLRILNPFDPLVRDRKRLSQIFGFDYRIEIFVPADKRQWGYYVYPILEGDKFVGRIDLKADHKAGALQVINFWSEPKIKWTDKRNSKLNAELKRLARFAGLSDVNFAN